jgi:hypothetical protein
MANRIETDSPDKIGCQGGTMKKGFARGGRELTA